MALSQAAISTAFQNVLQRAPSASELNSYFAASQSGALSDSQVYTAIITSPEAAAGTFAVTRFYQAAFGRVPDQAGLDQQVDTYNVNGNNLRAIGTGFTQSTEFTNRYGTDSAVTVAYLQALYVNVLGRTGSSAEIQNWLNAVATPGSGYANRADVLFGFAQSGEFIQNSNSGVINFLTGAAQGQNVYSGPLPVTGNVGTIFNLTTGADAIAGTAQNDVINASLVYATGGTTVDATSTLSAADSISGGAGVDTLNVTITGGNGATTFAPASITGVEVLNLRNVSGQTNSLDASTVFGLTNINADRSSSAVTLTGVSAATTLGVIGNTSVVLGGLDATYVNAATAATLNVSGGTVAGNGTDVSIAGAGLKTVTINSTGAANQLDGVTLANTVDTININAVTNLTLQGGDATTGITGEAANTKVTIAGTATTVNLGTLSANLKTIDASGLSTGGVTATLDAATATFTGGQGNDTITTAATTATGAVIAAGAGAGDRLTLAATNDVTTAAKAAQYTGFEILRNNTTGTVDASLVSGITSVELGASGAGATRLNATQAAAITNLVNNTAGTTLSLIDATGTSDVLGLTLKNNTAATSADLTGLTINGFETLNVVSSSGTQGVATPGNDLGLTAATSLKTITVSGAYDLALAANTALTQAATVTSTQTGTAHLDVSGTFIKGSSITTTANADTITTATVAGTTGDFVTYNAGAGNDTINTTLAALNNTGAGTGSVKIDGGAGVDTVSTNNGTYTDANFQFITNVEKLAFGEGALSVTTGGFFDGNFKSAGVEITNTFGATGGVGGANSTVDLTTFTGNVTETFTEKGTGDVANSVITRTGSGNDTITVNTNSLLTSTNNEVTTGTGTDTVTINAAALAANGKFTVNLGSGNDTLNANYAGAGKLDVTGGTGADLLNYSAAHSGVFNAIQGIGDSGTFAKPSTNTISTVNFDVITNAKAGDTITLSGNTASFVTTANTGADLSTATFSNQTATVVRGTYDSAAKTFVGLATGADELVVYDSSAGATVTFEAVVLVGHSAGLNNPGATGVLTLA